MSGEEPQPDAQPWYSSSQIRVALTVIVVPALIRLAQHTGLGKWLAANLGIDIVTMQAGDVVDWLMLALSAAGGIFWMHKRVKAGKNPCSDAPEIIPPKIVQRLTGNVPKQDPPLPLNLDVPGPAPDPPPDPPPASNGLVTSGLTDRQARLIHDYKERLRKAQAARPKDGPG